MKDFGSLICKISVVCFLAEFAGEGKKPAVPCYAAKICILTVMIFFFCNHTEFQFILCTNKYVT